MKSHQRRYITRNFEYGRPGVYHVISRTAFAEFRLQGIEREALVRLIRKQAAFCGIEILAYCILSNHFHLLVRVTPPPDDGIDDAELMRRYRHLYSDKDPPSPYHHRPSELAKILAKNDDRSVYYRSRLQARMHDLPMFMKELKQRFTRWYNRLNDGFGTVWAERYTSVLVEDTPTVMRIIAAYIELNPVRAGIVDDPERFRWCSIGAAAAGIKCVRKGIMRITGITDWKFAHASYRIHVYGDRPANTNSDRASVNKKAVEKVLSKKGVQGCSDLLRSRVRYFTEGAVLGSRAFIRNFIESNPDRFRRRKQKEGHPCSSRSLLLELHSLRKLKEPFEAPTDRTQ